MKKKNLLLLIIFVGILAFSIRVNGANSVSCTGVFGDELIDALNKYVFTPIKWIVPVLLLILTTIDFAGVVFSGDKKGMDKAKSNFLKRGIAALIIFFAPEIINLIVKLVNEQSISSCINRFK